MSLDFYLEETKPCEVCDANITHNLVPMWREAGVYEALYKSQGKQAKDIISVLESGVSAMAADPARFEAHNSPNGWGLYRNALPWLRKCLDACKENPEAIIRVSA